MDDMPTLGSPPPRRGAAIAAAALAVCVLAGAAVYHRFHKPPTPQQPVVAATNPDAAPDAAVNATDAAGTVTGADAVKTGIAQPALAAQTGVRALSVGLDRPLELALVDLVGAKIGPALGQVVVRALVWWVDVPADFRKGDRLDVLFDTPAGSEPVVHAVRFRSEKLGQTFSAYLYQPAGARWPRLYQPDGQELERRLDHGPIADYEQVTSLLRDGRGHKGVDFKTPVGTQVVAPFAGTVTRTNWNTRFNGDCIELKEDGGKLRTAMFLHLSALDPAVHVGARIRAGQPIAQSGNTGHSYAPHLHYQLADAAHPVLDPFASHPTSRRALPAADQAAFQAEVRRADALLDEAAKK